MTFTDAKPVPNIPNNPGGPPERPGSEDIEYDSGGVKSLFRRLRGLGVALSIDGDGLAIDAPAGVLSAGLLGLMRAHRDELLALVADDAPEDVEPLGLGSGWVCPWCRTGDRLAQAEPDGLRCGRCDRLAFRFVGDGVERCDWVEPVLIDAPEPPRTQGPSNAPEPKKKRASVVDRAGRSLFDEADESG